MTTSRTVFTEAFTRLLVVGQVPPPFGGQAIMIKQLLDSQFSKIQLHHVPMQFSKEMDQIGRFRLSKVFELIQVIFRIIQCRFVRNVRILYYPPAGPSRIAILRDLVILTTTRWLFDKTIFHFHAGSKKMAPAWMQRNGLEWAFRLMSEPRRLWKRYLRTNFHFILNVIRDELRL